MLFEIPIHKNIIILIMNYKIYIGDINIKMIKIILPKDIEKFKCRNALPNSV